MPSAKMPQQQHQDIVVVKLSEAERTNGSLSNNNMGIAVSAMHRDGIVVLENAVDIEHCDKLNGILMEEAEAMAKLPTTHFNEVRIHERLSKQNLDIATNLGSA